MDGTVVSRHSRGPRAFLRRRRVALTAALRTMLVALDGWIGDLFRPSSVLYDRAKGRYPIEILGHDGVAQLLSTVGPAARIEQRRAGRAVPDLEACEGLDVLIRGYDECIRVAKSLRTSSQRFYTHEGDTP